MENFWIWALVFVVLSPLILGLLLIGLQKKVRIIHSVSGIAKNGYTGYSWTYLFFGWFVPVVRGELGVGDGVAENVGIGMALQTTAVWDGDSTEHKWAAFSEGMYVVTNASANHKK